MSEIAERYRKIAGQFTQRVTSVPEGAWDNPAPCEGWVARDVVRHLVEWIPAFFAGYAGLALAQGPPVDEDPVGAWEAVSDAIQAMARRSRARGREFEMRGERHTIEQAIDMFCTGDVLVHTWDLARATGLDESLDADEVHRMFEGMEPIDDVLRQSGHYGARVEVPDDADEQTRLIAFTGRRPERGPVCDGASPGTFRQGALPAAGGTRGDAASPSYCSTSSGSSRPSSRRWPRPRRRRRSPTWPSTGCCPRSAPTPACWPSTTTRAASTCGGRSATATSPPGGPGSRSTPACP